MRSFLGFLFLFSTLIASACAAIEPRELRPISPRDRVLVLAPHPDDESLAAAGLLEKAVGAHAKIRVVFATNGEANPWAQRFVERRIHIGDPERVRWADRRKHEALRAV